MSAISRAVRGVTRAPGFTFIVLLTLALGIGATTAVFSVVNSVLIEPLPYPESDRLVGIWHSAPGIPSINGGISCSPSMYFTYREENRTFEQFGLWAGGGASVTGVADPEQVRAIFVTYGVLNALRVQPRLGRWFSEADTQPGAAGTVLLTDGYWRRRFGADASVVGRTLTVDGSPKTVIGVMPRRFAFVITDAELILPHQFDRNKVFLGNFSYQGVARLKPGASLAQADADIARMLTIWQDAWPTPPGFDRSLFKNARLGPKVALLKQDVVGDIGNMLWVLLGTIGLVLLIACANVANLLLVRAEGRQQEMAVRAALGAGWGRIARQMLLESVVIGLAGGLLGLGLAYAVLRILVTTGPATLPRLNEIGLDGVTVAFALAISAAAGLLFGLMPVLKYAKPDGSAALRSGGRTASHSRERHRARNVLVVTQVALALVLLVGSGLMIRTFQKLRSVQPGFVRADQVQLIRISLPDTQVAEPARVMRMQNDILDKIAALPGVRSVSFGNSAPMEGFNSNDVMFARDKTYATGQIPPIRRFRFVAPGYFQTLGTPIVAGRDFMWSELYDLRDVAIVSENLARELWGSPDAALGKQIREGMNDPWREIVGVAGDVYDNGVQEKPPTIVYWPALMSRFWMDKVHVNQGGVFVIRTERAATDSLLNDVRKSVWAVNPGLPVFLVRTLGDVYDRTMQRTSFTLAMLVTAGGLALVLGLVGIYGVISYSVSQRTREIGIRMALGAQGGALKTMFVRSGLLLTVVGVAIGLCAAAGVTRLMTSLLFGVTALDPMTYFAVPVALAAAALLASYVPARRAVRVDPVEALRAE